MSLSNLTRQPFIPVQLLIALTLMFLCSRSLSSSPFVFLCCKEHYHGRYKHLMETTSFIGLRSFVPTFSWICMGHEEHRILDLAKLLVVIKMSDKMPHKVDNLNVRHENHAQKRSDPFSRSFHSSFHSLQKTKKSPDACHLKKGSPALS